MSLLLDGIVLLIILLCFFVGWRRGAAITLLNFVALVAAFTVAVLLSPSLSNSIYETFAEALQKSGTAAEVSSGIHRRTGAPLGPEKPLLDAFKRKGVALVTASDSHTPQDVGYCLDELEALCR